MDREEQKAIVQAIEQVTKINTLGTHLPDWTYNTACNLKIAERFVQDFKPSILNETVFIVGPGASIHQYTDFLKELRSYGFVVAVPTAYPYLHEIGLEPDAVVAVDKSPLMADYLEEYNGPVICPLSVHPRIGEEHDCYWYTQYHGDGGPNDPTFGWYNAVIYYLAKSTGSSHGWISLGDVVNAALQIFEDYMKGYSLKKQAISRIVLVGVDRCFWKGYDRLPIRGTVLPMHEEQPDDIDWRDRVTNMRMVFYQERLYEFIRMFPAPYYRLDHGIQTEIPFVGPDQIRKGKYPKALTDEEWRTRLDDWHEYYAETLPFEAAGKRDFMEALKEEIGEKQAVADSDTPGTDRASLH